MKPLQIFLLVFFAHQLSFAIDHLPIEVTRDEAGQLIHIKIKKNKSFAADSNQFINSIQESIDRNGKSLPFDSIELEQFEKLSKKEKDAYISALNILQQKSLSSQLDDQKLRLEFDKIVKKITDGDFYKLLAHPSQASAFDEERMILEGLEHAIDLAQEVLGTTPLFNILEFLVDEYFDTLVHQRHFYQNALLSAINSGHHSFSEQEVAHIKSSIFYSRLDLYKLSARKKAVKTWDTFGLKAELKFNKNCKLSETTVFHYCFQGEKTYVMNLVDKNNSLSKKTSKAFDTKKPGFVGQRRWFILAIKLGLKLSPLPGVVKTPVRDWLESFYKKQRRTEGYLYSSLLTQNQVEMASWVLKNTANPLID